MRECRQCVVGGDIQRFPREDLPGNHTWPPATVYRFIELRLIPGKQHQVIAVSRVEPRQTQTNSTGPASDVDTAFIFHVCALSCSILRNSERTTLSTTAFIIKSGI